MRPLWNSRRDKVFDLWFIGVLYAIVIALTVLTTHAYDLAFWSALVLHLANVLILVFRRAYPITVGVIITLTTIGLAVSVYVTPGWLLEPSRPDDVWISLATPVAAYAVMMFSANKWAAWTIVGTLLLVLTRPWELHPVLIMGASLFTVLPATIALRRRSQKRLIDSLAERAELAEREQHLLAEAALAKERTRLAGEVHDVVSHRVVLMVLHAEALRRSATDDATREAATTLGTAGRQALGEMRELVGVLRGEPMPDGQSPPGLDELAELAEESATIGFPVHLVEDGERPHTSPVIGRTIHRIVREALTNVRKHAPAATTTIHVTYNSEHIRLAVRSTEGSIQVNPLGSTGSGSGLLGLRQRAELVGGTLRAGPVRDGGFLVEAELPAYVRTETT